MNTGSQERIECNQLLQFERIDAEDWTIQDVNGGTLNWVSKGIIVFGIEAGGILFGFDYREDRRSDNPPIVLLDMEELFGGPIIRVAETFDAFLAGLVTDPAAAAYVVLDRTKAIRPHMLPVSGNDIDELARHFHVPEELKQVWLMCGYGFFSDDPSGKRLTEAYNHLLHPEQVWDLRTGLSSYEVDPFLHGLPFFNYVDREHLTLTGLGEVIHVASRTEIIPISASLAEFFGRLMDDPIFYDHLLEGAST